MDIRMEGEAMLVHMYHRPVNLHKICTGAYPDFPTDMQSMVLSVASVGEGTLILKEQIFENRFKTVPWLKKMGADITPVSYTHLDVYKRQVMFREIR